MCWSVVKKKNKRHRHEKIWHVELNDQNEKELQPKQEISRFSNHKKEKEKPSSFIFNHQIHSVAQILKKVSGWIFFRGFSDTDCCSESVKWMWTDVQNGDWEFSKNKSAIILMTLMLSNFHPYHCGHVIFIELRLSESCGSFSSFRLLSDVSEINHVFPAPAPGLSHRHVFRWLRGKILSLSIIFNFIITVTAFTRQAHMSKEQVKPQKKVPS